MSGTLSDALTRFGKRSPLWIAIAYAPFALLSAMLGRLGVANQSPRLVLLAFLVWVLAGLALLFVAAWYREEDTVMIGVLVAVTVALTGILARIVVESVVELSIGAGILMLVGSIVGLFVNLLITIPLGIAFVWLARQLARAFGVTLTCDPVRPAHRARSA